MLPFSPSFVHPSTYTVATFSLALYRALEDSYPRMPAEEQRLLRHTMLDQTRPWEAMATDMPTLHAAIPFEIHELAQRMPGSLADALTAPAFIWGLTQDWVPNQASMIERVLAKWSAENVHNEFLRDANAHAHIQLMRMTVLLMDQLPFSIDPLVYAKVMKHAQEFHCPYNLDSYEDDTAGFWLQCLAQITIRAEDAVKDEMDGVAYDVWSQIAATVFRKTWSWGNPVRNLYRTFDYILSSTLPAMWILLTLREANPSYWTLPHCAPRLNRLMSPNIGRRILETPWHDIIDPEQQYKARETNHLLAKTFLPALYPTLMVMLPEDIWCNRIALVKALLSCVYGINDSIRESSERDIVLGDLLAVSD